MCTDALGHAGDLSLKTRGGRRAVGRVLRPDRGGPTRYGRAGGADERLAPRLGHTRHQRRGAHQAAAEGNHGSRRNRAKNAQPAYADRIYQSRSHGRRDVYDGHGRGAQPNEGAVDKAVSATPAFDTTEAAPAIVAAADMAATGKGTWHFTDA